MPAEDHKDYPVYQRALAYDVQGKKTIEATREELEPYLYYLVSRHSPKSDAPLPREHEPVKLLGMTAVDEKGEVWCWGDFIATESGDY